MKKALFAILILGLLNITFSYYYFSKKCEINYLENYLNATYQLYLLNLNYNKIYAQIGEKYYLIKEINSKYVEFNFYKQLDELDNNNVCFLLSNGYYSKIFDCINLTLKTNIKDNLNLTPTKIFGNIKINFKSSCKIVGKIIVLLYINNKLIYWKELGIENISINVNKKVNCIGKVCKLKLLIYNKYGNILIYEGEKIFDFSYKVINGIIEFPNKYFDSICCDNECYNTNKLNITNCKSVFLIINNQKYKLEIKNTYEIKSEKNELKVDNYIENLVFLLFLIFILYIIYTYRNFILNYFSKFNKKEEKEEEVIAKPKVEDFINEIRENSKRKLKDVISVEEEKETNKKEEQKENKEEDFIVDLEKEIK